MEEDSPQATTLKINKVGRDYQAHLEFIAASLVCSLTTLITRGGHCGFKKMRDRALMFFNQGGF